MLPLFGSIFHLRFVHDCDEPSVDVDNDVALPDAALVGGAALLNLTNDEVKTKLITGIISVRKRFVCGICHDVSTPSPLSDEETYWRHQSVSRLKTKPPSTAGRAEPGAVQGV